MQLMARSRPKKSPPKDVPRRCVALIAVDGAAIRAKINREYENARKEMEKLRSQLRRFQEKDQPAFKRWLHGKLGPLLTLCRELEQKIAAQEMLLFQVEETSFFSGISPKKAYERVMREKERTGRAPTEEEGEARTEKGRGHKKKPGNTGRGGQDDSFGDQADDDFAFPWAEPPKVAPQTSARLKELYRTVVRKLHPDLQTEMTAQKAEWWHQAQAAYEKGDTDQLEIILFFCEREEPQTIRNTSLSILQRITRALRNSLRPLRSQLRQLQRDPAWNFAGKQAPELVALARDLKAQLEQDTAEMKAQLAEIEEELADLKTQKGRGRRRAIDPFDLIFGGF